MVVRNFQASSDDMNWLETRTFSQEQTATIGKPRPAVLMHYNARLPHQVRHAEAFEAAGIEITPERSGAADVHIVSGPYFALEQWRNHPNVIWLDRAFYGDPEYVSIGWLNPDGTRTFASGEESRAKPECRPWKTRECSALVLADFQQDVTEIKLAAQSRFAYALVRRHPAESGLKSGEKPVISLSSQLMLHDVCIGHSSTALFEAVVMGVPVICTDPRNVVAEVAADSMTAELFRGDRSDWLHRVSYMQWNHDEFGQAVRLLMELRGI